MLKKSNDSDNMINSIYNELDLSNQHLDFQSYSELTFT